ncbi:MAG: methyltransferase, partial [Dermatophilaceae bacterium]
RRNAVRLGCADVRAVTAGGIPQDVRFDAVWSNPPIRVGKAALHDLLATWLPRLTPQGTAHLVVQKNLGSDSLQRWVEAALGMTCTRVASSRGFRVLEVSPARP